MASYHDSSFLLSIVHCKWSQVWKVTERIRKKCQILGDVLLRLSKDNWHGELSKPTEPHSNGSADYNAGESGVFTKLDRVMCVWKQAVCKSISVWHCTLYPPPPPLFMGWVFSILVMGSWDSIILALCSRLRSCTIEGLRSKKKASNMLYQRVFDKNSPEFRGILNVIVNFAWFPGFTWISQLHDHAKYQDPWKPLTKMYKLSSLPYSQVQYPWPCSFQLGIMPQLPALVKS